MNSLSETATLNETGCSATGSALSAVSLFTKSPIMLSVEDSTKDEFGIVLIVDDTPNNLKVLSATLADAEFEVAIATCGESALEQLKHIPVSLILLDVMMPGIDGFETCRQLKTNPETADIPVIFITALSDSTHKIKGFELGAVDYICKPFEQREVVARVRTHLKLSQLSKTLAARNSELKQFNEQLEVRVAERTEALLASNEQLQDTQLQIVQNEKMATVGALVAGVAHEINNPIGFLAGSIQNAKDYMQELCTHIALYQQHQPPIPVVQESADDLDLDFILEDLPKLLSSMAGATDRIKGISNSLRNFSRTDTEHKVSASLHEGLDSTLVILKYRLKANEQRPPIEITKDYGEISDINCFPGQLNQVFMNVLANAVDMFDEIAAESSFSAIADRPQKISIQTRFLAEKGLVKIQIADNGRGMPESVKERIFDRAFTTKEVGRGTGLGLAIAYKIITETHGGQFEVETTLGQGSTFIVSLPLQ